MKEQVVEFIQRLRNLDSNISWQFIQILEKFPSLNLVQDCNSIVEDELEKESSRLETKYYADLQHDQFDNEDSDYMNESDTFGNYDFKSVI